MNENLSVVVLAAGKGTRMKSDQAKVLHAVFFVPMIHHVLTAAAPLEAGRTLVIVGHQRQAVSAAIAGFKAATVVQEEQLGTGHAVLLTEKAIPAGDGEVMILYGDTPLLRTETLTTMLTQHHAAGVACTLMTAKVTAPYGYGRVLTTPDHTIIGIVEEKDATPEQKAIDIINTGIYLVSREALFTALASVDRNNAQGEFYLTDIVEKIAKSGQTVSQFVNPDPSEILGVNSRQELALAHAEIQRRRNQALMLAGVGMENPDSIAVALSATVEPDCLLEPGVRLLGNTSLGRGCHVGQGAILSDCRIDAGCEIGAYCCLTGVTLAAGSVMPPLTDR